MNGEKKSKFGILPIILISAVVVAAIALIMSYDACEVNGHTWYAATCERPKMCLECGAIEGAALGHSWEDATCEEPKICTVCGAAEGTARGHHWEDASCEKAKTCMNCGAVEGSMLGHTWQEASCTQAKTCFRCGDTDGAALGHDWIAATRTSPKTCRVCGETEGSPVLDVVAGDIITMGYYGHENMKWIVLEFDPSTNQALVLSKYCIDAIPFHTGKDNATWENCTLRTWLNNDFISIAFSQSERASLVEKTISNPQNPDYGIDSGSDTSDRVFLLSYEEALKYFPTKESRQGVPTDYCWDRGCYDPVKYGQEHGTEVSPEAVGYTWWWLRTAGLDEKHACNVVAKGHASSYGAYKISSEGAVRPAMWVQLG